MTAAACTDLPAWNDACHCITVDRDRLRALVDAGSDRPGQFDALHLRAPHLFADEPLFLDVATLARLQAAIAAIEAAVATPAWHAAVLADAKPLAHLDPGPLGVFYGYDFHLGPDGPHLIEINTNAGGALLNLALARAQAGCCAIVDDCVVAPVPLAAMERDLMAMFRNEWQLQRGDVPLRTVAIVDTAPADQVLHPEFLMFQTLFERAGLQARVLDPSDLQFVDGTLQAHGWPIDLVYNRLTDFYLEDPAHAALAHAFQAGAVVLTPHPRGHALYATKRNLVRLSDPSFLATLGLPAATLETLRATVPECVPVTQAAADALWAGRRTWFFKPADGFGSKAAYRGDKLTRATWQSLVGHGGYVAQRLVPPSTRQVRVDGANVALKADVRAYVYAGRVQLLTSRLYQGQVTNLRTPGGGFATVLAALG